MKAAYILTKFWEDPFIQTLTVEEKLLFLYLRTNTHFSISGIYEISIKTISFETGIEEEKINNILKHFEEFEKVFYYSNYIKFANVSKNMCKPTDNLLKGIENELKLIPSHILQHFEAPYKPLISPLPIPPILTTTITTTNTTTNSVSRETEKTKFEKPEIAEVNSFFLEKSSCIEESAKFFYFYESKGWFVGKQKMKNWKAAASGWLARNTPQKKDWTKMSDEELVAELKRNPSFRGEVVANRFNGDVEGRRRVIKLTSDLNF